ncbi:MAG: hypothetical protein ACYTHM_07285 [Planctomycetota bacterium]
MTNQIRTRDARWIIVLPLLAFLGGLSGTSESLFAREKGSPRTVRSGPLDLAGDDITCTQRGEEWVATARETEIRWPGGVLRADRAVVWIAGATKEDAEKAGKEDPLVLAGKFGVTVYAEGDVRVTWGKDRITCSRFLYDFKARKGIVLQVRGPARKKCAWR